MKNVLSDKQKHQLNVWVEGVGPLEFESRKVAIKSATDELGFNVTDSNLKSAENSTEIYVVKSPAPKKSDTHEARIAKLESDMFQMVQICRRLDASENLNIKPSAPKPGICHKHG